MKLVSYLAFNGDCEEAFKFYEKCLGGKITAMMPHEGTPAAEGVDPSWRSKIIHACLAVGEAMLMGGDAPPGIYEKPRGGCVSIHVKEPAEAERVFNALAEGAEVQMPLGETFWSKRFGMLTDKFGTPWMVNCEEAPTGVTPAC